MITAADVYYDAARAGMAWFGVEIVAWQHRIGWYGTYVPQWYGTLMWNCWLFTLGVSATYMLSDWYLFKFV